MSTSEDNMTRVAWLFTGLVVSGCLAFIGLVVWVGYHLMKAMGMLG